MKFYTIFFLLLACTLNSFSQELKVSDFRKNITDISARENPVRDANGDVCSIIKTRTGIENLEITTDLGIRKQEYREGEYWIWVPPGTSYLRFEGENFPVTEFELPEYTEEYIVYIILLTAVIPDKIEYKDISTVLFKTRPRKSEVFINDVFMGKAPVNVTIPDSTFTYRAEYKRRIPIEREITLGEQDSIVNIKLPVDKTVNHFFVSAMGGTNQFGGAYTGIRIGAMGRTGFFFTAGGTYQLNRFLAEALIWNTDGSYEVYYYPEWNYNDSLALNGLVVNRIRIGIGVNQRLFEDLYLNLSAGYGHYRLIVRLDKYNKLTNNKYGQPLYGQISGESGVSGAVFSSGLSYAIKDHLIITAEGNVFMKFKGGMNKRIQRFSYDFADVHFGIGYLF